MLFKPGTPIHSYEVQREAGQDVMYVNYLGANFVPNLAQSSELMSRIIDYLIKTPNISRLVFVQQRNYSHDSVQVYMLQEIANLYTYLMQNEKVLSTFRFAIPDNSELSRRYSILSNIMNLLKSDSIACYFELRNQIMSEKYAYEKSLKENYFFEINFLRLLESLYGLVGNLGILKKAEPYLKNYSFKNRALYESIFRAETIPNFTFTRLSSQFPPNAEIIDQYSIGEEKDEAIVTILKKQEDVKYFYHILPLEYSLKEEHHMIMNLARNVLIEHQPKSEEFLDTERARNVFFNVARDLIQELAVSQKIKLSYEEVEKLARILVRHTIGFGVIEVILKDKNIQDIVLNAPISQNPIHLRHEKYEQCFTNIIPSYEDAESWAAKFRMISGRPLDEANPILDTDLILSGLNARIAVIQQPLSPNGISYAIRRHRENPWTLPLFVKNRMINPLGAGLLSFLIDGARTILVAGTRSSGKSSLLGSLMLEIMSKYRIITIEDVLELPVEALRKMNYDILRMKVRSALLQTTTEVAAEEGIRTSLRLGDSCLIVGEVRSQEAKALYEAMRIGALANVVAGTIHGASPYGVFDRVVNDLNVPTTSFKATDCIIVANPVKTADGMHSHRRVLQISEVRKHWTKDPLEEKGFIDLLKYNVEKDELEATEDLINGDSEIIKDIAAGVKGWAGNWDAVYDNILLRAKIKKETVDMAEKTGNMDLLEGQFTMSSNNVFHQISEKVRREIGLPVSKRVFAEWQGWLNKQINSKKIS
jgi:type IV secretory pathway ATPase VirB11/archaellum biosynthesis ATPase